MLRCFRKCPRVLTAPPRKNYSVESTYHIPVREDEFTKTPQYPRIEKVGWVADRERDLESWYDKIKRQETIEEKLFEVNVPRYWGWKCLLLKEGVSPFDNADFIQHITRTHVVETNQLPGEQSLAEKCSQLAKEIKSDVEDAILYQTDIVRQNYRRKQLEKIDEEKETTSLIAYTINRVLSNALANHAEHIKTMQVDYQPRLEAFWIAGGMELPLDKKKERKRNKKLTEEQRTLPMDRWLQYVGSPLLHVRHELPLPPLVPRDAAVQESYPIPSFTLDPAIKGYETVRRHGTNIPGFWPGETREFPFLSYHSCNHINNRPASYGAQDALDTVRCQAVLASFGWLLSLACYQGFSMFHDPTYPITTQTILTDGRDFTLAKYQLNTTLLHASHVTNNPLVNLCWLTPSKRLYEDISEGRLIGFNEEVLATLIQVYLNSPEELKDTELKPYLGDTVKKVADIEEDDRRKWLEQEFKHFSTNRPRHRLDLKYEIYDWEQIYKIDHQMRPQDCRRRPFELDERPYHRKMSDHPGRYISRDRRPDANLPKYRQRKFEQMFYPK